MSDFTLITTFHKDGYDNYGKRMLHTLNKHMPKEIRLIAYYEGMEQPQEEGWEYRSFEENCGEKYEAFKKMATPYEHRVLVEGIDPRTNLPITPGSRFLFECIRFSHKYYAVEDAFSKVDTKYLIWCDADVVADKDVPLSFFYEKLIREDKYWSRLGRETASKIKYPECGFMLFDTTSRHHKRYRQLMAWMYDEGTCFQMEEWHDSYLWWQAQKYIEAEEGESITHDIGNGSGKHPFVRGVLGEYFDHLKGKRKKWGYSPERLLPDTWERRLAEEVK